MEKGSRRIKVVEKKKSMGDGRQVKELKKMDEGTLSFTRATRSGERRSRSMAEAVNGRMKTRSTQMKRRKKGKKNNL